MKIAILGTRGVPAQHGGFETFAEHLSLYLANRGWDVTVYCQEDGAGLIRQDVWRCVKRVIIPVERSGAAGTVQFDWLSIKHAATSGHRLVLTLGYNTASFCMIYRRYGVRNLINMDGIEWRRDKWKPHERAWLWLNERLGCWLGDHLIADHPEIANHLATRVSREKITVIPYGAVEVTSADEAAIRPYNLDVGQYAVLIARPEPENSVLEIVQGFSARRRGKKLVVLGNYDAKVNVFHQQVMAAASDEVCFLGAIYDKSVVEALRFYARFYVHGHRVGGTNPSLVEALGAGSAVLAHDNHFNRWVVGDGARYFSTSEECALRMDELFADDVLVTRMRKSSRERYLAEFTWNKILGEYERLLQAWA